MDLMEMWAQMGWVAKGVAVVLFIMSFWSVGVAIERFYTYAQARKQSKLYAPQVAKHLKEGRLKDAIAISSSKNYRDSHLAKVVLAGLQEYQFQKDSGGNLGQRPDDLAERAADRVIEVVGVAVRVQRGHHQAERLVGAEHQRRQPQNFGIEAAADVDVGHVQSHMIQLRDQHRDSLE